MRQHVFNEFDLYTARCISELYDWYVTDEIHGMLKHDAVSKDITSMVHYHPNDMSASMSYKPFVFLNSHILSNIPIHESALIITSACHRLSDILTEGYTETKSQEIQQFAEDLSVSIFDELQYPKVFHRI